ncbi:MAG: hypothetical protein PHN42_01690 [Bacilli bacterium]|nr:hypothetical protein [Bacilli bacterium]
MKKKKQNSRVYVIISLCAILFTMTIGYAIFSEALNINGTAVTTGIFDVQFSATSITSATGCTPTSTISTDKNGLTISVPDLAKPGSNAVISVTVKNTGNIDANLLSVNVTGNNDSDVTVTYPTWPTGVVLAPNETYTFDITVAWATSSTVANKNVTFTATLNYQQTV